MEEPAAIPKSKSDTALSRDAPTMGGPGDALDSLLADGTEELSSPHSPSTPTDLSPEKSYSSSTSSLQDDEYPPIDKLTLFDILGNLALPHKLEKWQNTLTAQKEKVKRQQEKLKSTSQQAKEKVVGQWRKRLPSSDEQLEKYTKRVRASVERLTSRWDDTATVTAREKTSFIAGVFNIFVSGYLIGACPEYFYYWFTVQLLYFMPVRYYKYHKKGYHYFLADLCYFVNLLTMLSVWVFPRSKRLFLSTYCLVYGNNAIAIAMWRNSLVFHSLDKVTSLFIHIMPPVTLHCLVHMTPRDMLQKSFPAVYDIKFSTPGSPEHYSLRAMIVWATVPYAVWQLSYHLLITVRRRKEIAAGRPTSYTWLRKSYANTWIGKIVLGLPPTLQEPAFMLIQYLYAILTIIPCPLWFWYRWASASFLTTVFVWSIYNGATYYIDVFGKRFEKELEQLKSDVIKWQSATEAESLENPSLESDVAHLEKHDESASGKRDIPEKETPPLKGQEGAAGAETGPSVLEAR